MSEIKEQLRDRLKNGQRQERDLGEITNRLQHQVNELVERVTGIRQVKRQYLTMGLLIGLLIGMIVGIVIGSLLNAVTAKD